MRINSRTYTVIRGIRVNGPRDAFKKGLQITSFLSLLKRDDIIWNPATRPLMHQGCFVTSNRATRGQIVNKANRIAKFSAILQVHLPP